MPYQQPYLERLYDVYGWTAPRYHVGYSIMAPFGAAPSDGQDCMSCYDAKSAAYGVCRSIPAGGSTQSARTACFEAADKAVQECLRSRGCAAASSGLATAAVIAGGLWLALG